MQPFIVVALGFATVFVPLTDATAPDFSTNCTAVTLKESDPKDNFVVFNVTDAKTYSIVNGSNTNNLFSINKTTGALSIANNDFETLPVTTFKINITGKGSSNENATKDCVLSVTIEDVNDNAPVFRNSSYKVTVTGPVVNGTSIVKVSATDNDKTTAFKQITYSLNGTNKEKFSINATGNVIASANLSTDIKTYELTLIATDRGTMPLTGTAKLTICVGPCPASPSGNGGGGGNGGNGAESWKTNTVFYIFVFLFVFVVKYGRF